MDYRDLGSVRGLKRGERIDTGNINRRRHTAWVAGTSNGGWWVSGAGHIQVGSAFHQESRWEAGENERS